MVVLSLSSGWIAAVVIVFFVIGVVLGGIMMSMHFKKQMKENPIISESQIREIYRQVGKKPSESQIKKIMNSIKSK